MKNTIIYYYGITIEDYRKREKKFIFTDNEHQFEYEFSEYYDDVTKLLNLYSLLKYNNKLTYEIILNKNREIITYFENKPYILLRKNNNSIKNKITLNNLLNKKILLNVKPNIDWKKLWKQKNEYYENYLEEVKLKYPLIKESSSYYFGMSELAINLLNYVDYDNIDYTICHKRIVKQDDLYNPLNVLIDNRIRDIAEFIKLNYMNNNLTNDEIINFIENNYFSKDESLLLLSRLIYPSYYFDVCEKIWFYKEKEENLIKIIKKNVQYETFLKSIYNILKYKHNIIIIEFLEN